MPKDHREITDDEVLNYDVANTATNARYHRIIRKRTIDATVQALNEVRGGLFDVKKSLYYASDKVEARMLESEKTRKDAAAAQNRLQRVAIALTAMIVACTVAYTLITWQSVQVQREANQNRTRSIEPNKRP